ncbi:hypothetical protein SteCoe_25982 [Stentor coeruleus]|uniref:Uncharacterized protein n=1 Tax=Stentor coeruleus TaxID=5963 RepID=A0A1R2BDZ3_9CILI|nr:hypothetical protein SteCoe_25982 [Stentor coeruleus]
MLGNWTKEHKFIAFLFGIIVIDFIFLLSSQLTKKWYSGGTGKCNWEGDDQGIYSSDCFSHKSYSDTECKDCSCCSDQTDVDKLGNSVITFWVILSFQIFWGLNLAVILLKNIDLDGYYLKLVKILTIPAVFMTVILLSVESFGIKDEKLHAGIALRIVSVVFFVIFSLTLFWLNKSLKGTLKKSLFNTDVTPLTILHDTRPRIKSTGHQELLTSREISKEFQ